MTHVPPITLDPIGRVMSPLVDRDHAPKQGHEGAPDAWLFRILANRCRTARRRVTRWSLFHSTDLDRVTPTSTARVDGFVARDEIWHALSELTEEQREAFLLRHVEGLSYEEIAAVAGIAVTAVRMRVSRACARLREAIVETDAERRSR